MSDYEITELLAQQGFLKCENTVEERVYGYAKESISLAEEKCNCEFLYKSYEGIKREEIPAAGHLAISLMEYGEPGTMPRSAVWLVRLNRI